MYERILIPLDGSDFAEEAIPFAQRMPSRGVRLLLVESPEARNGHPAGEPVAREAIARAYLETMGAPFREEGREVEIRIAYGDPAERIVEAAADVDLIVMTTHARGAGGRLVYGSYADRVARHAGAPTLLVRGGKSRPEAVSCERVVVPLDGSALAEQALPAARRMAAALGAPLLLVRIADPNLLYGTAAAMAMTAESYDALMERLESEAEAYLTEVIARLEIPEPVTVEVRRGSPAAELMEMTHAGDVIVMTSHGHGGIKRWFIGSVAERLVRQAAVPVLLVHARGVATRAPEGRLAGTAV